jgi:hypothetical protein
MNLKQCLGDEKNANWRSFFNVLVAYEDFSTGNLALSIFDRIFPGFNRLPAFSTRNVWKFDLLEIAPFREMAATEAAYADMIIISTHATAELPTAVKRWMEAWIKKRHSEPGALVVLLEGRRRRGMLDDRVEAYLQTCALRTGMDLFVQRSDGRHIPRVSSDGADLENGTLPSAILKKIITDVQWRTKNN